MPCNGASLAATSCSITSGPTLPYRMPCARTTPARACRYSSWAGPNRSRQRMTSSALRRGLAVRHAFIANLWWQLRGIEIAAEDKDADGRLRLAAAESLLAACRQLAGRLCKCDEDLGPELDGHDYAPIQLLGLRDVWPGL
ncbi:hypothetical protein TSOC_003728 [Tetrabaena socialis]|uniref:Uncharacterized protein n=1 Tax=Tetrabaena socialis TaxID=47790 RepID=A0A2J8AAW5_9CHLO|nr:hypothetical protein TSOC_003728 [Tetrabaena socialis]|eukprot:PNH09647.1 hypothetical protein TSOC_003728 [Tetrabaena socialis]